LQSFWGPDPDAVYFKNKQSRYTLVKRAAAGLINLESLTEVAGNTAAEETKAEQAKQAFDGEREIAGTFEILSNIIEERHLEESLRESEVKFRRAFNSTKDAVSLFHNGVVVECNDRKVELLGMSRDELLGRSPSCFSPRTQPDGSNSEKMAATILKSASAGEPQCFEWVYEKSDRTPVIMEVRLSRFKLQGEPYVQSVARDITELKRTANRQLERERSVREMAEQIRQILMSFRLGAS